MGEALRRVACTGGLHGGHLNKLGFRIFNKTRSSLDIFISRTENHHVSLDAGESSEKVLGRSCVSRTNAGGCIRGRLKLRSGTCSSEGSSRSAPRVAGGPRLYEIVGCVKAVAESLSPLTEGQSSPEPAALAFGKAQAYLVPYEQCRCLSSTPLVLHREGRRAACVVC